MAANTLFDNAANIAERARVDAWEQADLAQEQEAALVALNEWVAQYVKIAKVALRSKKQLLEKIGVTARTTKTKAQRAAPKKAAATRAAKKSAD